MKTKRNSPTRSKSARHNGTAGNDTSPVKHRKSSGDEVSFCLRLPAGAFDRITAKVGELKQRRR
jgi:hypothetical protein